MHYGWRRRPGSSRRRYWKALIVPLFAVAVILLGVLWEVSYGDADSSNRNRVPPEASKSDVVFAAGPGLGDRGAGDGSDSAGAELEALATRLKKLCGAGGAVKDGTIEIQGDHRDRLVSELQKLGFEAKRSGG